jgi:hypothetical protein
MALKDLVKQAWKDAGLYNSPSPGLKAFLDYFDSAGETDCWPEFAREIRARCPADKERLLLPAFDTGDRMLRLNVIDNLDANLPDERKILQELASRCDPEKDTFALQMIVHKDHPDLLESVEAKVNAPAAVGTGHLGALRMLVALQRENQPQGL